MLPFFSVAVGDDFEKNKTRAFIRVACDSCHCVLQFDAVTDRASMLQDENQFFVHRDDPFAAYFDSTELADRGAISAGWVKRHERMLCNRCRHGQDSNVLP
jgi:hypothetical protein